MTTMMPSPTCQSCIIIPSAYQSLSRPPLSKTFSDRTGRFPRATMSGAQYMHILYTEDANYIHVCGTIAESQVQHHRSIWSRLGLLQAASSIKPSFLLMDIEFSKWTPDLYQSSMLLPIITTKIKQNVLFVSEGITLYPSWLQQTQISLFMHGKSF